MPNLDASTALADLELLLGPDEKKLEEERKEKEEEAKYLKLKETREMKQKKMDEMDERLDERTRKIREENRKKFRVDLTKEKSGENGLMDLLKPSDEEEGGSKDIDNNSSTNSKKKEEKFIDLDTSSGRILIIVVSISGQFPEMV